MKCHNIFVKGLCILIGVFQNFNLEKSIITGAGTNLTVSALLLCHNRLKSKGTIYSIAP